MSEYILYLVRSIKLLHVLLCEVSCIGFPELLLHVHSDGLFDRNEIFFLNLWRFSSKDKFLSVDEYVCEYVALCLWI